MFKIKFGVKKLGLNKRGFQLPPRKLVWQPTARPVPTTPSPTLEILPADTLGEERDYSVIADIFGLTYAEELRKHSYGPGPIPLVLLSVLSLPPSHITTNVGVRRLLMEWETARLAAFGTTLMVSCSGQ